MADTGLTIYKYVILYVENCNRIPLLNLYRCQFNASAVGIEV